MRHHEDSCAEALDQLAIHINFQNRIVLAADAGVRAASLHHPEVSPINSDSSHRAPWLPVGERRRPAGNAVIRRGNGVGIVHWNGWRAGGRRHEDRRRSWNRHAPLRLHR